MLYTKTKRKSYSFVISKKEKIKKKLYLRLFRLVLQNHYLSRTVPFLIAGHISSLCLHFIILSAKAELDEMVNGLKSLLVLSLVRSNSVVARQLFVKGTPRLLTADSLYDVYSGYESYVKRT